MKILLCVTGSVASKLTPNLVSALIKAGNEVQVIATESSTFFFDANTLPVKVWRDKDEWVGGFYEKDSKIPHIELRNWADLVLIAPIDANTLAKIGNGLADNLLTCVLRAMNTEKPLVIAPAMNTLMWEHPITSEHIEKLKKWFKNFRLVGPASKKLACGDVGVGALAPIEDIVKEVALEL